MKQKQINTCAFSLGTNNLLSNFKFKNNTAIIIGNESKGISKNILDIVDNRIKIDISKYNYTSNPRKNSSKMTSSLFPKKPRKAAVACSIAVYEVSKQLNGK